MMPDPEARRWVFFDLGDTLFHLKPEIHQRWAESISRQNGKEIGAEELAAVIQDELQKPARAGRNLHFPGEDEGDGERAFLESLYRDVLFRLDYKEAAMAGTAREWDQVIARMVDETMNPESFDWRAGMEEVVTQLRAQEVPMGIISNAFASGHKLLEHFQVQEYFNPIVLSYQEQKAKPDREIFDRALQHAEVQAQESYFVDDRPAFRQAAAALGMRVLLPDAEQIKVALSDQG